MGGGRLCKADAPVLSFAGWSAPTFNLLARGARQRIYMAEFPALPLFTDAYMADTRHLTTLQHGAYLLMLMTAWRMPDCALPDDDVFLARITGLDRRTWNKNKAVLLYFWKQDDQHKWNQGRLKDERNYVEQLRNKNAVAGKASALKRQNRQSTTVPTKPQPNSNPHTHTLPIHKEEKKESNRGTRFALTAMPAEWFNYCVQNRPDLDADETFESFKDWWVAQPGQKGAKTEWFATWRTWVRNQRVSTKGKSNAKQSWAAAGEQLAAEYRAAHDAAEGTAFPASSKRLQLAKTIWQDS